MTILFIAFMAVIIRYSKERFLPVFMLIFGVAIQAGYQCGTFGLLIWMGIAKVAKDLFYAVRRS